MKEYLSYELMTQMGLPTPYYSLVKLSVNGVTYEANHFNNRVDQLTAMIKDAVETDPTAFYTYTQFETAVSSLKKLNEKRALAVTKQLAGDDAEVDASDINLRALGETVGGGGQKGPGGAEGMTPPEGEGMTPPEGEGMMPPEGEGMIPPDGNGKADNELQFGGTKPVGAGSIKPANEGNIKPTSEGK